MLEKFYASDLPFKQGELEILSKYWSIEQPQTQQLQSKLSIELLPGASQTIVLVLKSPTISRPVNMVALLKISNGN